MVKHLLPTHMGIFIFLFYIQNSETSSPINQLRMTLRAHYNYNGLSYFLWLKWLFLVETACRTES